MIRGLKEVVKPLMETFSLKLLITLLIKIVTIYSIKKTIPTPTTLPRGFRFSLVFGFGGVRVWPEACSGDIGADGLYIILL